VRPIIKETLLILTAVYGRILNSKRGIVLENK